MGTKGREQDPEGGDPHSFSHSARTNDTMSGHREESDMATELVDMQQRCERDCRNIKGLKGSDQEGLQKRISELTTRMDADR